MKHGPADPGNVEDPAAAPRLVHHFLEASAGRCPDRVAIVQGGRRPTYADLNRSANRLARLLIQAGVKAGDRVALLSENSVEDVAGFYGILKAGGIAVPLNTELTPDGLTDVLEFLEAEVLLLSPRFERPARAIDRSRLRLRSILLLPSGPPAPGPGAPFEDLSALLDGLPDDDPGLSPSPDSCAVIIFTSGSEGRPKGVMLSHANIAANTRSIVQYLALQPSDIQMVVLPFFYVMGMSLLNTHVAVGGTLVLNNQFAYTAAVLKQMAAEGVTGFSGVPSTYAQLVFKSPLAQYRDKLPALRYCSQAGGHMPRAVKLALLKALPSQTRLIVMYGATEAAARLTYLPPESLQAKIDSIGVPIPGVALDVLSPDGRALGPGECGELVARGENIMLGYFRDEDATREVLDGRGYHTGDLGFVDEDGFYFVTGRKDDQLKIDGHRVNPREIEDTIVESGQAMECLVVALAEGFRDRILVGLAVPIEAGPGAAARILEYCRAKLPKYKVPRSLVMTDAIPKNSSGKPDRARALEIIQARTGRIPEPGMPGVPT
jgi:long-chain acyl-CoA synthetase